MQLLRLFEDEEKRKMMMDKTKRMLEKGMTKGKISLEKGFEKSKEGIRKAWKGYREERARRERERAYEEEYEAEFRYRDGDFHFRMPLSAEEARLYERAKKKLNEVKRFHSDPRVHQQWESKKYLSLHDYFTERIRHYCELRHQDPVALHLTIRYCERQIEYAPVAIRAYRLDPYRCELPQHPGFEMLTSLNEENGEWEEALRLAREARDQGWDGDWDLRVRQLEERVIRP
ncbi:hypothetical protein C8P63_11574 [Melghirimyces profundicolus]|uniref:Uncharacterized protein n=1 Tax=Melghirimyces profundicolus TaxID=1242148 RepID=A0A2T6BRJ9_9BACL|nr:hypothetical protein [Melghirimyces profundicolus]PTX58676.1 hypothetical protein C8P63_11574 [Melghirimyces profundicolus]